MNTINIPLKGINRASSDISCENGTMDELINLRHTNGSLQPIGDFPSVKDSHGQEIDFSPYERIYLHRMPSFSHLIVFKEGKVFYLNDGQEEEIQGMPEDLLLTKDVSISYNANIIDIAYQNTEGNITKFYLYWDGDKYIYVDLDFITPLVEVVREEDTSSKEFSLELDAKWGDAPRLIYEQFPPFVNEKIYNFKEKGIVLGNFTWMYAVKLYDGTYIRTSPLMFCSNMDKKDRVYINPYDDESQIIEGDTDPYAFFTRLILNRRKMAGGGGSVPYPVKHKVDAVLNNRKLEIKFNSLEKIKQAKKFIISVDVFMSSPIMPIHLEGNNFDDIDNKEFPFLKSAEELKKEYELKSTLFKVASYSIDEDLDLNAESQTKSLYEEINLNNLEVSEKWEGDFDNYATSMSDISYLYNGKTHKARIKSQLGNVFPFKYWQDQPILHQRPTGIAEVPQTIINTEDLLETSILFTRTLIKGANGESIVVCKSGPIPSEYLSNDNKTLNKASALLSYPDGRAYSMSLVVYINKDEIYGVTVPLKQHHMFNIAYYLSDDFRSLDFQDITNTFDQSWFNPSNTIEERANIMKVSEVDNPFTYPIEQTYSIGSGQIIGLCSNTQAISTGQFGEYPLYAFCSDGIYVLGLGNGEVEYASIRPASRDVCNNPDSITPIDNAVVFSSNRGLLMIAGETVQELSTAIEGTPYNFLSGISRIDLLQQAITNDKLVQLLPSISTINFKEYIKKAVVGFIYNDNRELIVSNPNYDYSYIYSLDSNTWSKLDLKIDLFINNYPNLYALCKGKLLDLTQEQDLGQKQTFFLTRPIKFNAQSYVRPIQAVLRSLIKPVMYSGLYVFGSVDGLTWRFLGGREYNGAVQGNDKLHDFLNIGCQTSREKMRYLRIGYVGNIKFDSKLEYLEIIASGVNDKSD